MKKTISKLKKELDKWFSLYIRLRGVDDNGNNQCCTCGTIDNWKKLQCGHFVSRKHLATRFHEMNCFPQCVSNTGDKCTMYLKRDNTTYNGVIVETRPDNTYDQTYVIEWDGIERLYYHKTHDVEDNKDITVYPQLPEDLFTI